MLFHMSMSANDHRKVAAVIAELWNGKALPFPPVSDDGWIVLAGDDRGTAIEVYPAGTVLRERPGDADAYGEAGEVRAYTPTHAAIASPLDADAILAIAAREGWPAKYRKRGGAFGVIEMWIEGCQMIEVLAPEMQREYLATMTIAQWEAMLAAGPPARTATL
ncbi:hypothetical protein PX554_00520 [Sphingomonas sp. H39-1-10]|uniref:hypothetical protein n=1 Tax=Sphingomonas TaxID=13687 RepID=UPI00088CB3C1|nr:MULTISPECIES: hypothetical protein [Sphingomonas]MDF0486598.1 hypothetical protein [Sphingomonas pollutisoli]SDA36767.1 hypothetical protein SAMN03159340_03870 [Sphingomonas sp. NFR15]